MSDSVNRKDISAPQFAALMSRNRRKQDEFTVFLTPGSATEAPSTDAMPDPMFRTPHAVRIQRRIDNHGDTVSISVRSNGVDLLTHAALTTTLDLAGFDTLTGYSGEPSTHGERLTVLEPP